jgi:hypothetical protein
MLEFLSEQMIPQILKNLTIKAVDAWIFNSFKANLNKLGKADLCLNQNRLVLMQSSSNIFYLIRKLRNKETSFSSCNLR